MITGNRNGKYNKPKTKKGPEEHRRNHLIPTVDKGGQYKESQNTTFTR